MVDVSGLSAGRPVVPVSVVIPAFNRERLIERAVRSALSQRPAPPAEVIVVDDASSDLTADRAATAGAHVVRLATNGGEGRARNVAVEMATSDWIALLDSDDEWFPHHLSTLWPLRAGHVLLGTTAVARGAGPGADRLWGRGAYKSFELRSPADVLQGGNALVASTALFHRPTALAAGGFRQDLPRGADLDLWLRMLERGRGTVSSEVTVMYQLHGGQASDDRAAMWRAHHEIVEAYSDRPWCTSSVRRASDAILQWDELRAAIAGRQDRYALELATRLSCDPVKLLGVGRLLLHRHRVRRQSATYRRERLGLTENQGLVASARLEESR